jgi:uncharacterized protein (TIGR02001 family)
MRKSLLLGLSALAMTSAFAAPAAAADLGGGFSVSGGATIVSDYRFRGISQSFKNIALQGTMSISHKSGFYATVWGSTIDDYIAAGGDEELDLIAGYKHDFHGTTLDMGVLYYYYPGSSQIFSGYNSDFFEPYISVAHTFGPVTAKLTANYAPKQKAISVCGGFPCSPSKEDNLYIAGDLTVAIPKTPVSLTGHLGHTWGPSWLSIGKSYTDWAVGASVTKGPLTVGVSYVDTNKDLFTVSNPYAIGATHLKNISKAGVVGSIGVAF